MNGLQAVSHVSKTEKSLSKDVIQALYFICDIILVDKRPSNLTTLYSKLKLEVVGSPDKAIQLLAALLFLVGDVANIPANSLLNEFKLEKKSLMDFLDVIKLERCRCILTRGFYVRFCFSLSDPDKNQLLVTLCGLIGCHHENYDLYKIFNDLERNIIRYNDMAGINTLAQVLNDEQFQNIDKSFLLPREHAASTDIGWYDTFSPNGSTLPSSTLPSTLPSYHVIDQQYHNRDQQYQRYHSEPNNDITYSSQYSIPLYNPPSLPANIQNHFHSQVSYPSNPPQGYSSNPTQGYSSNPTQGYSSNPTQGYSSNHSQGYSNNPPPQGYIYSSNPPQGYSSNPQGYSSNLPGYSSLECPSNPPQRYPHDPQHPSTPPGYISNPSGYLSNSSGYPSTPPGHPGSPHSTSGTSQSKSLQRNIPPISQQQRFNQSFPPYGSSSSSSSGSSCSSNISVAPVSQFNLPPVANQYQPQPYQPQPGLATPTTTHYHTPHLRDTPSQYSSISPDRYSNDPSLASIPYYQYPVHPAGAASPQPFQGHNNVRDVASSNDHHRSNIAVRSNKPKPKPQSFS